MERNRAAPVFPLMLRRVLLGVLLLAGCSQGPTADLQYIKQARTLAAEWALVNEQAKAGRATDTCVRSMHYWLIDGLRRAQSSLTQPDSPYGHEMQTLLAEPADASPAALRVHVEALKQIERQIESA